MYLTDQQIRRRIDEFVFEAEPNFAPFDPDEQIGPCSVDLRLSAVYWKPEPPRPWRLGRPLPLDLSRATIMEAKPNRGWRRVSVRATDVIVLKPKRMILARTCESFRVPTDCAGSLEGRSSYSRMGISVHPSAGFINPGYYGRMPIILYNESPFTIRVPVGLSLCQVIFIGLTEIPKLDYASRDPKYLPDYGGPSYWWRDDAVRDLHKSLTNARYDSVAIDRITDLFAESSYSASVYERMERRLLNSAPLASAEDLLTDFGKTEDRREFIARATIYGARASFAAWLGVAGSYLIFDNSSGILNVIAVVLGALFGASTLWGLWQNVPEYLTTKRLRKLQDGSAAVSATVGKP